MKRIGILLLVTFSVLFSSKILAKNHQTSVLGFGVGYHGFAEKDDPRKGTNTYNKVDEVGLAGVYRLYGEWYPLETLGLGFLANYQVVDRTYSDTGGGRLEEDWSIGHYFATINIVLLGGTSYARLGLYAGGGPATYRIRQKLSGTASDYNETASQSGTATTLGIYLDWGEEDFGVRTGYQSINSSFPELEINNIKNEISSTGATVHFDLRWAF